MSGDQVHFLLVPDSGAARRLRRTLTVESAREGVLVGVWSELLELARQSYLVEPKEHQWDAQLLHALMQLDGAFWSKSLEVATDETAKGIASAYRQLLTAKAPAAPFCFAREIKVSTRAERHLRDLSRLHVALSGALPDDLAAIESLLSMSAEQSVRTVHVYHVDGAPRLDCWQQALVAHLNSHSRVRPIASLQCALTRQFVASTKKRGQICSLQRLQAEIFATRKRTFALDNTVQWLGVRDFLEESEVAAGMVQSLLTADRTLVAADIGVLIPSKYEYEVAVEEVFTLAGLPLAGVPKERWRRDLGREAICYFLACREMPAPAMALATCLTSPLMPWERRVGTRLAQQVMDGNRELAPWQGLSPKACAMLELLRKVDESPASLARSLAEFVSFLDSKESHVEHIERAKRANEQLQSRLAGQKTLDWSALRLEVIPHYLPSEAPVEYSLEGVTVWREGMEPWRLVRHLLVLGFAAGHYPVAIGSSSVFSLSDLQALATSGSLALETPRERMERFRALFRRQIGSASDTVSFLIPRRNSLGEALAPSDSLAFMLHLFGVDEEQILNLDIAADRAKARFVPELKRVTYRQPTVTFSGDLELGKDLLRLRVDSDGKPKPESPSALETLMVSPLAWLLMRLGAEPLGWLPEVADVRLLGSLSHLVFQQIFACARELPERNAIPRLVDAHLQEAIEIAAPFLHSPQWQVECRLLQTELTHAARVWHDVLTRLKARVLDTETWLYGTLDKLAIHGQADALLGLPGKRVLVVDYKKSSANGRRKRMEAGYDSQAHLYRVMLQTGGLKDLGRAALVKRLEASHDISIVYFTLNDATVLSDSALPASTLIPVWNVFDNEVASEAISLIGRRIRELKRGHLRLNRVDDAEFFDRKAGVTPYAFERSPLIGFFMMPAEDREQ